MARCTHTHGKTLCFECFRMGMDRTRARREAWAQRALPFEPAGRAAAKPLTEQAVAHRRQMLEYLATTARRRA